MKDMPIVQAIVAKFQNTELTDKVTYCFMWMYIFVALSLFFGQLIEELNALLAVEWQENRVAHLWQAAVETTNGSKTLQIKPIRRKGQVG